MAMKQRYWIMLIVLIQTHSFYGMMRTAEQAAVPHQLTAKRMKLDLTPWMRAERTNFIVPLSGRSSAMDISEEQQKKNSPKLAIEFSSEKQQKKSSPKLAIEFSEMDMHDIVAAIDAISADQKKAEQAMTPQERDKFYKLALIRAIGDDSGALTEDDDLLLSGEDKDDVW